MVHEYALPECFSVLICSSSNAILISKVPFIILPPITNEAIHSGLMRQFELSAMTAPTYSTLVCCCMPS